MPIFWSQLFGFLEVGVPSCRYNLLQQYQAMSEHSDIFESSASENDEASLSKNASLSQTMSQSEVDFASNPALYGLRRSGRAQQTAAV